MVGQNVDFKVTLQVGTATTKVDVTAEAPLVEDTKIGVTSTVGKDQIVESADQRPARGQLCAADPGGDQRRRVRADQLPRHRGGQRLPHGRQRHHQQFLQRERRPHPHRQPAFAGRGAGIPGALQRLLRRIRPRHGRRDQHRHQERRQRRARHRLLVLPQPHAGSGRPLLQRRQGSGMAPHRGRQRGRRASRRTSCSTSSTSITPTAISRR